VLSSFFLGRTTKPPLGSTALPPLSVFTTTIDAPLSLPLFHMILHRRVFLLRPCGITFLSSLFSLFPYKFSRFPRPRTLALTSFLLSLKWTPFPRNPPNQRVFPQPTTGSPPHFFLFMLSAFVLFLRSLHESVIIGFLSTLCPGQFPI